MWRLDRKVAVLALLILLMTGGSALAAARATHPYRLRPTRDCLGRHRAHFTTRGQTLTWEERGRHSVGTPVREITIYFYSNPARASANAKQDGDLLRAEGFTDAYVQHHILTRQNVILNQSSDQLVRAALISTVTGCLRG